MTGPWLRRSAMVLVLVVLTLGTLTARVVVDGERALASSDEAFDRGDVRAATVHARRAAVLYAPGAPHVEAAYRRLIAIASGAEAAGQSELAIQAWQAVRSAALETRHVWIPREDELRRANQNLKRLQSLAGRSPEERKATAQAATRELERDDAPRAPWITLLAMGFLLAVAGFSVITWRGVTPDGDLVPGAMRMGVVIVMVGVACWIMAVLNA